MKRVRGLEDGGWGQNTLDLRSNTVKQAGILVHRPAVIRRASALAPEMKEGGESVQRSEV